MEIGYSIYIVLIVIGFFWAGWKWLWPYLATKKDLDILSNKLKELQDNNLEIQERILDFDGWIRDNSKSSFMVNFILPSWNDYLDKYKQFNQKGLPFIPDVYDFFLEDNLLQNFGKRKLVDSFPGILLSLGIIGTFFGIALGVSGLNARGSAEAMQAGITVLLAGMKVKFSSSIAGILLSIVWQFVDKSYFYPKLINSFRILRQGLDITFPTQEQNTVLSQMLLNQEKQMEDFQAYVTETMIPSMVSGMSQAISQSLTPHLEQTQSMVQTMMDTSQVNQIEGINSMVDHFVQSLSQITGDHMKELGEALHTTIEWQQRVHSDMSELVQTMQDAAKEQSLMVEKTTTLTGQINNYTEKITDYHTVMENMIHKLNETTDKNGQLQINISDLLEKMTAERDIFHEHFESHMDFIKNRVSEFTLQSELQIELNNKLASNLEHYHSLSQTQQLLSETLENMATQTEESNKETSSLIEKMNDVSKRQAQIQQELNSVFEAVVSEKSNVGDMLTDMNENLILQLSDMDKRIEHLRNVWESTSNVFTSVNKQLAISMNQFTDDMHRGLEHTFSQFDDELAKSVNYLAKAVSAIHEGVSDLPDSIETLKTSVTELNKHAKLMIKHV